ncbi:MAG: thiamine-phosphate kinase, partial [Rhodospirillales bacterium]|nr:thiamine-phosphate kinase [Rhodospirillales bacterium]
MPAPNPAWLTPSWTASPACSAPTNLRAAAVVPAIDEFGLIAELFAPLAESYPGALGLTDDCALVSSLPGTSIAVTADAIVAGVHFLADDPPDLIARKLLRVNLSDLAAMGAVPFAVLMTAAFPRGTNAAWLRAFAEGLRQDLTAFAVALIGGDTVATPGPLTLSVTAMGRVEEGGALRRSAARPGDLLFVSGSLGDAALGLRALQGGLPGLPAEAAAFLIDRSRVPRPRL